MGKHLQKDIILIVVSIGIGIFFARIGFDNYLLEFLHSPVLASFIAGIFFTSLLTIAPASVVLAELAAHINPIQVALWGALGAVVGDLILFYFIRDRLAVDITELFKAGIHKYHLDKLHSRYMRWLLPVVGALIIASPLPDELGIMLLGFSKMKTRDVIPLSFIMNFIGVLLVIAAGIVVRGI